MSLGAEPIVILGTFRGGTSCLATALVAMGLYMGDPKAVQPANELNQSGFWELQDIQALNAQAMATYGMSYLGADHMPSLWCERPETDALLVQARAILLKHFSGKQTWGWKEPGTSSLFELYAQLL